MDTDERTDDPSEDTQADDPEENSADEAEKLLEEWGVTGGPRKRKGRALGGADFTAHPGFLHTAQARQQHISNLVACMRHYASIRDDAALAHVLAALLQAENPANLQLMWQYRQRASHARMAEVLMTGYALLRRHPSAAGHDALRRYLRRARPFQITPAGRGAVTLELARLMLDEGHPAEAYDELASLAQGEGEDESGAAFERALLMGTIRHRQWGEAMREAARGGGRGPGASQASQSQGQSHARSQPQQLSQSQHSQPSGVAAQPWDAYSSSSSVWARAGRGALELCGSAEEHLRSALRLRPSSTHAAALLVQLALAQRMRAGKWEALRVAREQCRCAPRDIDAHATCLALLLSEPSLGGESAVEAAQRARCVLDCDPACAVAAQALVDLSLEHGGLVAVPTVEGLCCFLDTTPPARPPAGLELLVWQAVGVALRGLAASVCARFAALRRAQAELRGLRGPEPAPGALDAAADSMRSAHGQLGAALGEWRTAGLCLQLRAWWADGHLLQLPPSEEKATELLASGGDAESLVALAMVAAAQRAALVAECSTALPQRRSPPAAPPAAAASGLAAALRRHGFAGLADQLDGSVAQIEAAHAAEAGLRFGQAHAAASLASASAAAATFETEVGRSWEPPHGWQPVPMGSCHPALGHIAALPAPWWQAFPVVRRREARQAQLEQAHWGEELGALVRGHVGPPPALASPAVQGRPAAGAGAAPTPAEVVGSQPTQRAQRRVRFQDG